MSSYCQREIYANALGNNEDVENLFSVLGKGVPIILIRIAK